MDRYGSYDSFSPIAARKDLNRFNMAVSWSFAFAYLIQAAMKNNDIYSTHREYQQTAL